MKEVEMDTNKTVIVLYSYHHNNTELIAKSIAEVIGARIVSTSGLKPEEIERYELIGFGSGIYSGKHHSSIFDFIDKLKVDNTRKAFIFSTSGVPGIFADSKSREGKKLIFGQHSDLREILESKGFEIIGEFSCPGFNTNSFLKRFGGINRKRPNAEDIKNAKEFSLRLKNDLLNP